MRVLLTNDDGIRAEGLRAMYRALREAGHTVHVVAPMHEQSGVGHSLTFFDPLRAHKIEEPDFEGLGLYGTPTDCVKLALGNLLKKRPDMVISGINAGSNVGPDILYSGTVGAATEAAHEDLPSMALSCDAGGGHPDMDSIARHAVELAARIDAYSRESGGLLRGEDLAAYAPRWVAPVHTSFRGCEVWELPPNGQGMTALLALNLLEALPLAGAGEVDKLHMMMEAMKLAFADALHYIADPAYMRVSPEDLLSKEYARARAACITDRARVYAPGEPLRGDTVYFCAADGEGNSISMIQSLYEGFGSGVLVPGTGICLQNRGACFSLAEGHANVVAPRKYPYHTIIPGFLTRNGKPLGPFGIMGGYMQPQAHMQVLVHLLDEGHNPQAALDAPRFCWTDGLRFDMEPSFPHAVVDALRRRGDIEKKE